MRIVTLQDLESSTGQELAAATKLAATLSTSFEEFLDSETEPPRAVGVHASEISDCMRKIVYSLTPPRPAPKNSTFWRRKFAAGHMIHRQAQSDFRRWAENSGQTVHFEREIAIRPENRAIAAAWGIQSSADGVFTLRNEEGYEVVRVLLEIKSMSSEEFKKLKEPDPKHVEQAHVYMKALNIPFVWFYYWNKDTHAYTASSPGSFLRQYDPAVWGRIEDRIAKAYEYLGRKQLPDREEGFQCELCAWRKICGPDYLAPKPKPARELIPENVLQRARRK